MLKKLPHHDEPNSHTKKLNFYNSYKQHKFALISNYSTFSSHGEVIVITLGKPYSVAFPHNLKC